MSSYYICVYAIAKNEEQFALRWANSMSEADDIFVLDTGSSDRTVSLLQRAGVHVTQTQIDPFRFDTARNLSLDLVPEKADICVCTDLDEVFHPGWRKALEAAWTRDTCRARYRYTWNFLPDGSEGRVFWLDKIHTRHHFTWIHPVHEVLVYKGPEPCHTVNVAGVQLDHHADAQKSRAQYLPLLELAVQEAPQDDRNMHYLGREYLFYRRWNDCIRTLQRHLSLPTATWRDERCASMRYIARAYWNLGKPDEARTWLYRAIAEAPWLREPWIEAADLARRQQHWSACYHFAQEALAITQRPLSYICEEENWGAKPYDLSALSAYYLGLYEKARQDGEMACQLRPNDTRLRQNLSFYTAKAP